MKKIRPVLHFAAVILLGTWAWAQEAPKSELSFDYSWARINPTANYTQWHALNGGGGTFKYNIGQHFGIKADLQGYNSNTTSFVIPAGAPNVPKGAQGTVSGNLFTYLFGPEFAVHSSRLDPFFNVLLGAAHTNVYGNAFSTICQPTTNGCSGAASPSDNAFALSTGIGLNIPINHRIDIKAGEFDYLYTDFKNVFSSAGQNNFRYVGGLNIKMGTPSLKIPTVACGVEPSEVLPWAGPVKATASPVDFNPKHPLTYNWESSGGTAAGQGGSATVNTDQMAPGQYTVKANVSDPKQKKNNTATCSASFTVKQPKAPVVACSASPSTVKPGEPVSITVSGSSPDLSAIDKHSFSASAGALKEGETQHGNNPGEFTSTATLDTSNVAPGPISVNVGITDVHGQSSTCTASAEIEAPPAPPPPPPAPTASVVGKCDFKQSGARVDNQCKAVMDGVALQLQRDTGSRVVIIGFADDSEAKTKNLPSIRAANVRTYLTKGEGKQQIDTSRIEIRKSSDQSNGKAAEIYFVPENGVIQVENTDVVDESTLPKKRG